MFTHHKALQLRSALCLLLAVLAHHIASPFSAQAADDLPPAPQREFRAAWVATVANIDWPSKRGLSTEQQQQELLAIADRAVELRLNALIFQVRPHCDALYASKLEPWSEYLTGTMGQPPEPYYDPLAFIVKAAHERGLELHAWFNPYRALHAGSSGEVAELHVSKTKSQIVRKYGKQQWLDPGDSESADHSAAVILDVVQRYDIDGVHFDDYFYPYQVKDDQGETVSFPDDPSWQKAQAAGNTLKRDDWRRQNVDQFIQRISKEVHAAKPWVKFGISPFGIWRPGHPPQIKGYDAYASLYADAKKWWNAGWVDYLTPQLYWNIESSGQSYPVLMQWWHEQNQQGRHLWPGNYTSRVANESIGNWTPEEITQQIKLTREHSGATGNVHFSMKALLDDSRGMTAALKQNTYSEPALVPASPWLASTKEKPARPILKVINSPNKRRLEYSLPNQKKPWLWVVSLHEEAGWQTDISPGHVGGLVFYDEIGSPSPTQVAVAAVNRLGDVGPVTLIELNP